MVAAIATGRDPGARQQKVRAVRRAREASSGRSLPTLLWMARHGIHDFFSQVFWVYKALDS